MTVKTGSTGICDMLNALGEFIALPPNSLLVICANGEDDIDTCRRIVDGGDDRATARRVLGKQLLPLV